MAVVLIAWVPSREAYQAVHDTTWPAVGPPPGCIVHAASEANGRVRIVEVWESQQHFDEFMRINLGTVLNMLGFDLEPPELTETFSMERG